MLIPGRARALARLRGREAHRVTPSRRPRDRQSSSDCRCFRTADAALAPSAAQAAGPACNHQQPPAVAQTAERSGRRTLVVPRLLWPRHSDRSRPRGSSSGCTRGRVNELEKTMSTPPCRAASRSARAFDRVRHGRRPWVRRTTSARTFDRRCTDFGDASRVASRQIHGCRWGFKPLAPTLRRARNRDCAFAPVIRAILFIALFLSMY